MRILIVEDDPTSRMVLEKYLSRIGEIRCAADGEEGLAAVSEAFLENRPFDLICLDIMMPKFDGQAVLRQVREMESRKGISEGNGAKIIMTTALSDKSNLMEALPRCDAYLTKPIDLAKLMFYIQKFGLLDKHAESAKQGEVKPDK